MDDSIFQLVFLAILAVAWVIKTIAEEGKRRGRRAPGPPPRPGEVPTGGRPEAPRRFPTTLPAPPRVEPPPPPRPRPTVRRTRFKPETPVPGLAPHEGSGAHEDLVHLDGLHGHADEPPSTSRVLTSQDRAKLRQQRTLARLMGNLPGITRPKALRTGVLWREVLGPPRAVSGPHVPPHIERGRRR